MNKVRKVKRVLTKIRMFYSIILQGKLLQKEISKIFSFLLPGAKMKTLFTERSDAKYCEIYNTMGNYTTYG